MYLLLNPKTQEVLKFPIVNIRREFPNISFPKHLTNDNLPDNIKLVTIEEKPVVGLFENTKMGVPQFDKDKGWHVLWEITEFSDSQKESKLQSLKDNVLLNAKNDLDNYALKKGYDNITNMCTYKLSDDVEFYKEGTVACNVRDYIFRTTINKLNEITLEKGNVPEKEEDLFKLIPSVDEYIKTIV